MKLFIVCLALVGFAGQAYAGGLPSCRTISSTGVAAAAGISEDGQSSVSVMIKRDKVACEHLENPTEGYSINLPQDAEQSLAWARVSVRALDEAGQQVLGKDLFVFELGGNALFQLRAPLNSKTIVIKIDGFNEIVVSL